MCSPPLQTHQAATQTDIPQEERGQLLSELLSCCILASWCLFVCFLKILYLFMFVFFPPECLCY